MKDQYLNTLRKFKHLKVLVVGDLILDVYLRGNCGRVAPEACIPVVDLQTRTSCLGGAANVASNLSSLGATVFFCTVIGDDAVADEATTLLKNLNISDEFLVATTQRTTLIKTRICASSQPLVRLDAGNTEPISASMEDLLIAKMRKAFLWADAVLISDYEKGILTDRVIAEISSLIKSRPIPVAVDAKKYERFSILKTLLIKPNYLEATQMVQVHNKLSKRAKQIRTWGEELYQNTNATHIALTLDADGVAHFKNGHFDKHFNVPQITPAYTSGAGDTFLATCFLAMTAKMAVHQAIEMAIKAAAHVIAREETATCSHRELLAQMIDKQKNVDLAKLLKLTKGFHSSHQRIVFTSGCFDILHSGHVNYLKAAKANGDILIVGLNTDESIRRLKGTSRPINTLKDRIEVLSELNCIDYIVTFGSADDDTPIALIKKIKPNVFVKGDDYRYQSLPEAPILKSLGCDIVFVPLVAHQSTTKLINKISQQLITTANLTVN